MTAPYAIGDTLVVRHTSCDGDVTGPLPVVAVTTMDGGRFRVTCTRDHDTCPTVAVVVDRTGREIKTTTVLGPDPFLDTDGAPDTDTVLAAVSPFRLPSDVAADATAELAAQVAEIRAAAS